MLTMKDVFNPFYLIFTLAGPLLLCYSCVWFLQTQLFLQKAEPVEAVVTYTVDPNSEEPGKTSLEFSLGEQTRKVSLATVATYKRGDVVQLLVRKAPLEVHVNSFSELYQENIACFLVGLLVAFPWWIVGFFWIKERVSR